MKEHIFCTDQLCTVFTKWHYIYQISYRLRSGFDQEWAVYFFWIKHLEIENVTPAHFGGNADGQRTIWNGIETWITLASKNRDSTYCWWNTCSKEKLFDLINLILSHPVKWDNSISFPHCPRDWHVDSDALTLDLSGINKNRHNIFTWFGCFYCLKFLLCEAFVRTAWIFLKYM